MTDRNIQSAMHQNTSIIRKSVRRVKDTLSLYPAPHFLSRYRVASYDKGNQRARTVRVTSSGHMKHTMLPHLLGLVVVGLAFGCLRMLDAGLAARVAVTHSFRGRVKHLLGLPEPGWA